MNKIVLLFLVFAGCSTNIKMVGEPHEKISKKEVQLINYQYSGSEEIALIEVKGRYKYSKSAGERRGIRKAKRKAAKLGANAIVIMDRNYDHSENFSNYMNGVFYTSNRKWVNLMTQAVYIKPDSTSGN